ncbi:hypothetical protein B0H11DRAFT_2358330 [Mycena galericulata]|nr:hypothetical protein B0H11DRAFT_2358330 [Mycena galericulata]
MSTIFTTDENALAEGANKSVGCAALDRPALGNKDCNIPEFFDADSLPWLHDLAYATTDGPFCNLVMPTLAPLDHPQWEALDTDPILWLHDLSPATYATTDGPFNNLGDYVMPTLALLDHAYTHFRDGSVGDASEGEIGALDSRWAEQNSEILRFLEASASADFLAKRFTEGDSGMECSEHQEGGSAFNQPGESTHGPGRECREDQDASAESEPESRWTADNKDMLMLLEASEFDLWATCEYPSVTDSPPFFPNPESCVNAATPASSPVLGPCSPTPTRLFHPIPRVPFVQIELNPPATQPSGGAPFLDVTNSPQQTPNAPGLQCYVSPSSWATCILFPPREPGCSTPSQEHNSDGINKKSRDSTRKSEFTRVKRFNPLTGRPWERHRAKCTRPADLDIAAELARLRPTCERGVCEWDGCNTIVGTTMHAVFKHMRDVHGLRRHHRDGGRAPVAPCLWPGCAETARGRRYTPEFLIAHVRGVHLGAEDMFCPYCPGDRAPFYTMNSLRVHLLTSLRAQ